MGSKYDPLLGALRTTDSVDTSTLVLKAGDTMTGNLQMPSSGHYTLPSSFLTVVQPTHNATNGGWSNFTLRNLIDTSALSNTGLQYVRVTFSAKGAATTNLYIKEAYIGLQASSGNAYNFASAPTQLTFNGGSASAEIPGTGVGNTVTITSDPILFSVSASSKLMTSVYTPTNNTIAYTSITSLTGWQTYYKAGNDASTVSATGYTTYQAGSIGVSLIEATSTTTTPDLVTFDNTNGYIGVKNTSPTAELDVSGGLKSNAIGVGVINHQPNTILLHAKGTPDIRSIQFNDDPSSGFYWGASNQIIAGYNGTSNFGMGADLYVGNNTWLRWMASNDVTTGSPDTNLKRKAAGQLGTDGDFILDTVGKGFYVKEGTNATMGVATLVGGTVTVSTTKVTANSRIFLTTQSLGTVTTPQAIGVTARTAGTSFTITSANALDTSVVAWQIIEPS